jgi:hypothetical protein
VFTAGTSLVRRIVGLGGSPKPTLFLDGGVYDDLLA